MTEKQPSPQPVTPGASILPDSRVLRAVKRWLIRLFLLAGCWLLLRTFVLQGMYIPSDSMSGTLQKGDYLMVNKLVYGARIPFFPELRIPGYGEIERQDILVFNLPGNTPGAAGLGIPYIKRCAGLPGDSVEIKGGLLFINDVEAGEPDLRTWRYRVTLQAGTVARSFFSRYSISDFEWLGDNDYAVCFSQETAIRMKQETDVLSITRFPLAPHAMQPGVFGNTNERKWNADNFGPVRVPSKGLQITLTKAALADYYTTLTVHEGNRITTHGDSVFVNENYMTVYTFKYNYYFVLGDNRMNSSDSRKWGFVPETHIIGKASYLMYNNQIGFSGFSELR